MSRTSRPLWWLLMRPRASRVALRLLAPHKLHPETLYGMDGEPPHWVRADLAKTPRQAAEYLARENEMTVENYGCVMDPIEEIHRVWMLERPPLTRHDPDFECEDDDCDCRDDEGQYVPVDSRQRGAVAYWKWSW